MSFKVMILLKRRDNISAKDFKIWWLNQHKPMALKLDGLRKMVINITQNEGAEYDGVSELWFDSEADFASAYATDHGKAVAADSMSMVSRRDRLLVSEHE